MIKRFKTNIRIDAILKLLIWIKVIGNQQRNGNSHININISIYLSIYLTGLSIYLYVCISIYLST